jgi:hypothetical protein
MGLNLGALKCEAKRELILFDPPFTTIHHHLHLFYSLDML